MSGKWFEGAAINYYEGNWALSWQTLWVGPLLVDGVLGATSERKESLASDEAGRDVSAQLPGLLAANRSLWKEFCSYLYADSASSAGKYLEAIAESFDGWSVSYNQWIGPLEAKETGAEFDETPRSWAAIAGVGVERGGEGAVARRQRAGGAGSVVSVSAQRLRDAANVRGGAASGGG